MESGQYPTCHVVVDGDRVQLIFQDEMLHRQADLEGVYEQLEEFVQNAESPDIEMDLANVHHILSESLGWLIYFARMVRDKSGKFRLINVSRPVYRAFEVARFTDLADVVAPQ